MPWYVKTLFLSQPLHFGDYGGLLLKVLWGVLDIFAIVILGSGVYLWLRKPRALTVQDAAAPDEVPDAEPAPANAMRQSSTNEATP